MRRGVTLGQMLLVLTAVLLLTFIIFGPECDDTNSDVPECGETICVPLDD
jgi:competence protein ComGC